MSQHGQVADFSTLQTPGFIHVGSPSSTTGLVEPREPHALLVFIHHSGTHPDAGFSKP